jgi:hypothetical protein
VTSEPHSFKDKDNRPLNFHWTTTIALDGSSATTQIAVAE